MREGARFLKRFRAGEPERRQRPDVCRLPGIDGARLLQPGGGSGGTCRRASKGRHGAGHPVPVMLLARLAVDRAEQGRGLGKALVRDALLGTAAAADIAGIRALLVHAKDNEARAWYEALEFEPSPTDPRHLFLLMKDLRAMLGE